MSSEAPIVSTSYNHTNYEEQEDMYDAFLGGGTSIKLEENIGACYAGTLENPGSLQSTSSNYSSSDAAQVDIYRDLILRHLIQDITSTCAKLNLPTDPNQWTSLDCSKWVEEMCLQFQLPAPQLQQLQGGGPALLGMTVEDFCCCVPDGGDTLHAQLQLWKTAFESYNGMKATTNLLNNSQHQSLDNNNHQFLCNSSSVHNQLQTPRNTAASSSSSMCLTGWITPPSPCTTQRYTPNTFAPSLSSYYSTNIGNPYGFLQPNSLATTTTRNSSSSCCSSSLSSSSHALQHVLPSPSESDMSSSNSSCISAQDLTDDEYCNEIQFFSPSSMKRPFPGHPTPNYSTLQQPSIQQQALHQQPSVQSNNDPIGKKPSKPIGGPYLRSGYGGSSGTVHLWHFIRELLDQPKQYSSCVRWVDRQEGLFKIESSHNLARCWACYYKKGIIQKPEKKQRLVYKFLPPYNL
uniref:PNT domain-containing protein n=1 Tax=Ditylenchus dipsaci TaxID=166011 RepID=A0A915CZV1_9BILA